MSETYVTYRVWDGCKAPINLEYSGRLIGQIVRESTIDRDALLALADDIEEMRNRRQIVRGYDYFIEVPRTLLDSIVSCIRKSCGEQAS